MKPTSKISLDSAYQFHDKLNPVLFANDAIKPNIKEALLKIAKHFNDYIGIDIKVVDIILTGSNASYTYTAESDIDVHLIVDVGTFDKGIITELLNAKKNEYNTQFDITVKGIDVELYAERTDEKHESVGIYSLMKDEWIQEPEQIKPSVDGEEVMKKYISYREKVKIALKSDNVDIVKYTWDKIKKLRQSGLNKDGVFSVENLAFKLLRANMWMERLGDHFTNLQNKELSIESVK